MQNKFIFNAVKYFLHTCFIVLIISALQIFHGCSGSDDEELTDDREKDSIEVYTGLQKAFVTYKKALAYNETSEDKKANESFESSLKYLDEIRDELLVHPGNYLWKKDFEELARSVVEDYLTTQSEIKQNSLVFDFAKRISVTYHKVEQISGDREPLPDGSDIPLVRNSAVDEYIDFFSKTDRGRSFIDKCLYRSGKFFPLMRKILKFNNAPEELIYLSVQESGLNPTIVSRAGAVGLWQFMPSTGYSYGLSQDQYRDDRRDFEKSTDAAARHLKDLYRTFDDWYLAFSAYNAGPGRVNSAIRKSGSHDFWSLRSYLPGETKNYVPSIIALSYVLRSPEEYGFNNIEYGNPVSYDRVNIKAQLTLQKVADLCETDIESIRELNPEITNDILPDYDVAYQLRIPHKTFDKFASNYKKADDIDKSNDFSPEFAGNEVSGFGSTLAFAGYKVSNYEPADVRKIASKDDKKKVEYEFTPTDALAAVAVFYDVRPIEIRLWNNLSYGTFPKKNQKLEIYITEEKYKKLYGIKSEEKSEDKIPEEKETENINLQTLSLTNEKVTEDINSQTQTLANENVPEYSDNNSSQTATTQTNSSMETNKEIVSNDQEIITSDTEENSNSETEEKKYTEKKSKEVSKKKNTNSSTYIVEEGDYLSIIAQENGVTIEDLMEWNDLQSDKIFAGQKLKIHPSGKNKKTTFHTVDEGENLTMIAKEYGMTLAKLKELNDIKDDKILVGQKLKVTETVSEKKNTTKTSGVRKTYKVKKGETLASIAESNDISIQDLIKWNKLKNDRIKVGQILKLYSDKNK